MYTQLPTDLTHVDLVGDPEERTGQVEEKMEDESGS